MTRVRLQAGKVSLEMELKDTATTKALIAALPFEASAQTWGEEVYFTTPVSARLESDARQVVARPKLANACNVLGSIGNFGELAKIRPGDRVRVEVA